MHFKYYLLNSSFSVSVDSSNGSIFLDAYQKWTTNEKKLECLNLNAMAVLQKFIQQPLSWSSLPFRFGQLFSIRQLNAKIVTTHVFVLPKFFRMTSKTKKIDLIELECRSQWHAKYLSIPSDAAIGCSTSRFQDW